MMNFSRFCFHKNHKWALPDRFTVYLALAMIIVALASAVYA
jgi:hypothetical protein